MNKGKKKIMVFLPHPDDELLVAGALIYTVKKEYDIRVVYLTNGDSNVDLGQIRIIEAVKSLRVLGIKSGNVEFLGYGNNWKGNKHIYNTDGHEIVESIAGKTKTYGHHKYPEYCRKCIGVSREYTRDNIKKDIRMLVEEEYPEILICVDYDSHPDHRALSLLFEETLGEILKEHTQYKPIVLKKFAYAGMYNGRNDYYYKPHKVTQRGYMEELLDDRFELDNPTYKWEERLQFDIDKRARTGCIHKNILFKAAQKHKTQKISKKIGSFSNADMVYWQRRTDSLSYRAKVSATSGEAECVNDFKCIDTNDVLDSFGGAHSLTKGVWMPDQKDDRKILYFDFEKSISVSAVHIYENFIPGEDILKAKIRFDNGNCILVKNINHSGKKTEVVFEKQENIKHIEFQILEGVGSEYGITEFEIYEEPCSQIVPFKKYVDKRKDFKKNIICKAIDEVIFHISTLDERDSIYFNMYKLMLRWSYLDVQEMARFMKKRKYEKIAIYGLGDLGIKLFHDLITNNIEVSYGIDNLAGTKRVPFPVYRLDSLKEMPETDVIIITFWRGSDKAKCKLKSLGIEESKILMISDLIRMIEENTEIKPIQKER